MAIIFLDSRSFSDIKYEIGPQLQSSLNRCFSFDALSEQSDDIFLSERFSLICSADFMGIRESRRIDCEYNMCMDDFHRVDSFDDEIGRYSYPVDIHPMSADKKGADDFQRSISLRHDTGESYSIPYRCLVPKGIDNLWVTGRCIGSDRAMQASLRVIPGCYITGQAAGCAAALCVSDGCRAKDADINKIKLSINNKL